MGTMGWLLGYATAMIVIVLAAIIVVFQRANRMPPEEIVRRRYARGEIDREQYEQMLEDLKVKREDAYDPSPGTHTS